ncbi:hypothetical protein [Dyella flagellata]|uniref:hypothetical protein n=1 Tax=Dyella flagellata TaxID=1867833 RepID=UPI0024E1460F|nr:hypothetical protein [Dyella flagellata]
MPSINKADTFGVNERAGFRMQLENSDWLVETSSIDDSYLLVVLHGTTHLDIAFYGFFHLMRFTRRMTENAGVRTAVFAHESILA